MSRESRHSNGLSKDYARLPGKNLSWIAQCGTKLAAHMLRKVLTSFRRAKTAISVFLVESANRQSPSFVGDSFAERAFFLEMTRGQFPPVADDP
jgi:hypothetical protein